MHYDVSAGHVTSVLLQAGEMDSNIYYEPHPPELHVAILAEYI
jgi:hypothetical protein